MNLAVASAHGTTAPVAGSGRSSWSAYATSSLYMVPGTTSDPASSTPPAPSHRRVGVVHNHQRSLRTVDQHFELYEMADVPISRRPLAWLSTKLGEQDPD